MPHKIAVLYHNDADGFGAAFAAWYGFYVNLPPNQELPIMYFIEVQYGQEPPLAELKEFAPDAILILGFSYKREILLDLVMQYPDLIVVDHHKTAQEELQGLNFCVFDLELSGCRLAWDLFCKDEEGQVLPVPAILGYVEDRDLWRFKLPHSKEANAYIGTLPNDFVKWLEFDLGFAIAAGTAILAFQSEQIERRLKDVTTVYLKAAGGDSAYAVPCVNASENISELGHAMLDACPGAPFSMSYCDRKDGTRSYSLRSRGDFDVSEVAKHFGGGGHAAAAGFTLPAPKAF